MRDLRIKLGEGITGMVAARRQGMVVQEYRTSPYAHAVFKERTAITATLAEPLVYGDRLVGAITVNHESADRTFSAWHRETLALLAGHAAIAIENARLYTAVRAHAAELEARVAERTRDAVSAVLGAILVIARGLATKKGKRIVTEVPNDLPPLVADPVRFKQILFNLLSNAVKFTPDRGTITVRARPVSAEAQSRRGAGAREQYLEVTVIDTGVGIRAEDLPRLFTEFTQLQTTQQQWHEGTGLGLALTKRLVELHGGRVWAESEGEGKGSTFTVQLPVDGVAHGAGV
jgi:K+-sensing histidine kinase KdpD